MGAHSGDVGIRNVTFGGAWIDTPEELRAVIIREGPLTFSDGYEPFVEVSRRFRRIGIL